MEGVVVVVAVAARHLVPARASLELLDFVLRDEVLDHDVLQLQLARELADGVEQVFLLLLLLVLEVGDLGLGGAELGPQLLELFAHRRRLLLQGRVPLLHRQPLLLLPAVLLHRLALGLLLLDDLALPRLDLLLLPRHAVAHVLAAVHDLRLERRQLGLRALGLRLLVADPLLLLHQHGVLARILLGRQQVGVEEALPLLLGLHLQSLLHRLHLLLSHPDELLDLDHAVDGHLADDLAHDLALDGHLDHPLDLHHLLDLHLLDHLALDDLRDGDGLGSGLIGWWKRRGWWWCRWWCQW